MDKAQLEKIGEVIKRFTDKAKEHKKREEEVKVTPKPAETPKK